MSSNSEKLQDDRNAVIGTSGYRRVELLLDQGSFNEIDGMARSADGFAEAVAGYGTVEGSPVYVFSQNSDVCGGAMSKAQASKIKKIYQLAVKTGAPVIGIFDSVGGRLNEGADMLAAYGEILLSANNLSGVVPQISLVLGPCTGTSAMIAAGADFVVMSDKGELTIGTAGEGGSPAEAAKLGICHIAAKDEAQAIEKTRALVSMLPSNNISEAPMFDAAEPAEAQGGAPKDILVSVCDAGSFVELSEAFGKSCVTGFARLGGASAGLIFLNGEIDADSCSKAARFVRFCDSFSMPAVTFVDAGKFASLREASKLSSAYSEATTAKVTVVTGTACGAVYIAVVGRGANSDYAIAWPDACVSALAPETAAIFLHNDRLAGSSDPIADRRKLIEEYKTTEASAFAAAAGGLIEDVAQPEETRAKLLRTLDMLSGKRVSTLPKKHANIQL